MLSLSRRVRHRLIVPLLLAWVLAAAGLLVTVDAVAASAPAPAPRTARYEIAFLEDMIDHHAMAVMMAEHCLHAAVHPALVTLCQEIATAQTQEIEMMQTWLTDWYGISHEPELPASHRPHMDRMMAMTGEEFEIAFMTMMIRHHWTAIVQARQCLRQAYHSELLAMCQDIIETQRAEIVRMQTWLCDWYDLCHYGPRLRTSTA